MHVYLTLIFGVILKKSLFVDKFLIVLSPTAIQAPSDVKLGILKLSIAGLLEKISCSTKYFIVFYLCNGLGRSIMMFIIVVQLYNFKRKL